MGLGREKDKNHCHRV